MLGSNSRAGSWAVLKAPPPGPDTTEKGLGLCIVRKLPCDTDTLNPCSPCIADITRIQQWVQRLLTPGRTGEQSRLSSQLWARRCDPTCSLTLGHCHPRSLVALAL